jgi:hypothetical protein
MTDEYTLRLMTRDRVLFVLIAVFFGLGGLALLYKGIRDSDAITLVFSLVWLGAAGWQIWKGLSGPLEIHVLSGEKICLRNWFGLETEISMSNISEIKLESNMLSIKTPTQKFISLSGYDGLHKFVHDVASANEKLITKGI